MELQVVLLTADQLSTSKPPQKLEFATVEVCRRCAYLSTEAGKDESNSKAPYRGLGQPDAHCVAEGIYVQFEDGYQHKAQTKNESGSEMNG